jgi:hypothetical protein
MTLHQLIAYWSETTLDNISGQSEMELKPFLVKEAKYIYLIVFELRGEYKRAKGLNDVFEAIEKWSATTDK